MAEKTISRVKIQDVDYILSVDTDNELDTTSENPIQNQVVATKFQEIEAQLAEALYKEIAITSFTNNVGTVELGSTVNSVTLTWKTNKTPTALTLNGASVGVSTTSHTYRDLALKPTSVTTKTYTLEAKDEKKTVSKSTSITFANGIYYGKLSSGTIDSAAILTMNKKIQNSRGVEFTTTTGAGEHIAYACPKRLAPATFTVGVLQGGFQEPIDVEFTNSLGFTETYCVYLSTNPNLGEITVKVS